MSMIFLWGWKKYIVADFFLVIVVGYESALWLGHRWWCRIIGGLRMPEAHMVEGGVG